GVKGVWTFRPEILYAAAMEPTATAAPEDVSGHSGHATIPDMPTPHNCRCTPVAPNDIATRLGIPVDTVNKWRQRGGFPVERWRVGNSRAWCWEQDILPW